MKIKHVKNANEAVIKSPSSSRVARGVAWGLLLLCAGFVICVQVFPDMAGQTQDRYLTFSAKFSSQNQTKVWCDTTRGGLGHSRGVQAVSLPPSEQFSSVRVPLSRGDVRYLRLDFLQNAGTGTIRDLKITDENGGLLRTLDPSLLLSLNPAAKIVVSGSTLEIRHERPDDYPVFYVQTEYPIPASAPKVRVTTGNAWVVVLTLIVGFIISLDVFRRRRQIPAPMAKDMLSLEDKNLHSIRWALLWLFGLFVAIWGAKLLVIRQLGMSLPYWDAWNGEAWDVYIPFFDHTLSWRDMFERFTDHRHFFDRLKALLLITINPQWDTRFETVINGAMHTTIGCGIVALVWRLFEKKHLLYISGIVLLLFAFPYSFQPQILAFWTPYYFLQGFTVLTLWLMLCHRAFSSRWLLGVTCAICSIFTLASGVLVAAVVSGVSVALLIKDWRAWKQHVASVVAGIAVMALAFPFLPFGQTQGGIPAQSFEGFLQAFLNVTAWPTLFPALNLILWLPWFALGWCVWRKSGRPSNANIFLLSLGLWALLQAAGIAVYRNDTTTSGYMQERHMSIINFGMLVNALAGAAVYEHVRSSEKARRRSRIMVGVWWSTFLVGFSIMFLDTAVDRMRVFLGLSRSAATTTRTFAATDETKVIFAAEGQAVPIVENPLLALSTLRNKYIRQILPEVAPALAVNPAPGFESRGFRRNNFPRGMDMGGRIDAWSSYSPGSAGQSVGQPEVFQSEYIQATRSGYIQLDVAGRLGIDGLSLELRGKNGEVVKVPDGRSVGGEWRTVVVRSPRSDFCLVAIDQRKRTDPWSWFGFSEVRPITIWSAVAFWLVEKAPFILGGGFALLVCMLMAGGKSFGSWQRAQEVSVKRKNVETPGV